MNKTRKTAIVKQKDTKVFSRGNGVETRLVIGEALGAGFTTGFTSFPAGSSAPLHFHNCDEQVTIIAGRAEVEFDHKTAELGPHDSTFIPAGKPHRFKNIGSDPLVILWIYDTDHVTRTFVATGKTVEHLSGGDTVRS